MALWRASSCRGRYEVQHDLGSRQRNGGRFLQPLYPKSEYQKMELDPIYETISFVSCCPLLSQAGEARRGLRAAELRSWRSRMRPGATRKAGHSEARKSGPGEKTQRRSPTTQTGEASHRVCKPYRSGTTPVSPAWKFTHALVVWDIGRWMWCASSTMCWPGLVRWSGQEEHTGAKGPIGFWLFMWNPESQLSWFQRFLAQQI